MSASTAYCVVFVCLCLSLSLSLCIVYIFIYTYKYILCSCCWVFLFADVFLHLSVILARALSLSLSLCLSPSVLTYMYVCVRTYACPHVSIYVCMYVCIVCMHACMHACMYANDLMRVSMTFLYACRNPCSSTSHVQLRPQVMGQSTRRLLMAFAARRLQRPKRIPKKCMPRRPTSTVDNVQSVTGIQIPIAVSTSHQ